MGCATGYEEYQGTTMQAHTCSHDGVGSETASYKGGSITIVPLHKISQLFTRYAHAPGTAKESLQSILHLEGLITWISV